MCEPQDAIHTVMILYFWLGDILEFNYHENFPQLADRIYLRMIWLDPSRPSDRACLMSSRADLIYSTILVRIY